MVDVEKKTVFLIPARKNSKGLLFKNRLLFKKTASTIPKHLASLVYVTSDDDDILLKAASYGFKTIKRPEILAQDETDIKSVIQHFRTHFDKKPPENLFMLYLTYPERTWHQIEQFMLEFEERRARSMLCKKQLKTSPYLMLYSIDGDRGRQIINHDLYRRQDYHDCFELSHFIFGCKFTEVESLNKNLYNSQTIFYSIAECVDVDTEEDLEEYENKNNR
jgi:CMP-N-acetylneuraminic acid synthetase